MSQAKRALRTPPNTRTVYDCEVCTGPARRVVLPPDEVVHRCHTCGHLEREGVLTSSRVRAHPWGGSASFDRVRVALTYRRLRRGLGRGGPFDVLELGPGEGGLLRRLERAGHRVSAVEPGLLAREEAQELAEGTLWRTSAEDAPLPEGAFELIVAIHVVEHLVDPALVFRKCFRSLRPGGRLYVVTPNAESRGIDIFGGRWWNFEDPTHRRFFTPRSLAMALWKQGFLPETGTPLPLDSLSMESSSALRFLKAPGSPHGTLAGPGAKLAALAMLPLTLAARTVVRDLSPSFQMWATRPGTRRGTRSRARGPGSVE